MSYHHQFTGETCGIRPTAPLRWRPMDGMIGALWTAQGEAGGGGYYVSANPRISVFFEDVASIRVAGAAGLAGRPMGRVIYVPAGTPMWTRFTAPLDFSHLDIHFDADRAVRALAPAVGRSAALAALQRPSETAEAGDLEALARLLAAEIETPARHALYAETLANGLLAGVLDLGAVAPQQDGRLTGAQMRRITARFEAAGGRRLSLAAMAEAVGLSESWFSHVFRNTTGMTPLQWQSARRVEIAKTMLADRALTIAEIADRLGFSDQAHLTRVFRQVEGETPAAWRRARRHGRAGDDGGAARHHV
jgi:AraC family transcriptional regulator